MVLVSIPVARILRENSNVNDGDSLPTPFQFSLLLQLLNGETWALWGWKRTASPWGSSASFSMKYGTLTSSLSTVRLRTRGDGLSIRASQTSHTHLVLQTGRFPSFSLGSRILVCQPCSYLDPSRIPIQRSSPAQQRTSPRRQT